LSFLHVSRAPDEDFLVECIPRTLCGDFLVECIPRTFCGDFL
jgi:hypothetical protein